MASVAAQLEQVGGYALIHRRLLDHPAFQNEPEAWAFASLIMRASWRPCRVRYKGTEVLLERGQLAISVRDFAAIWGWSKSKADRFFGKLEREQMAIRKRDTGGTASGTGVSVLTICNYDKYQDASKFGGTAIDERRDSGGTQNKEENKGKEYITPSVSPPSRKTAWKDEGEPPLEWVDWAVEHMGWSRRQAEAETRRFIDNSVAHRRMYADWLAAWRNWCRSPFQKTVASQQERLTL